MKSEKIYWLLFLLYFAISSCKKEDQFLNATPKSGLSLISNLNDLQLLLQADQTLNIQYAGLGELSTDDFYVISSVFNSRPAYMQNVYIWAKNPYPGQVNSDWNSDYHAIYVVNRVLDGLQELGTQGDQTKYNSIKGTALFFRATRYYDLLQNFAKAYQSQSASNDMGVPLRLSSDINDVVPRSSVQVCYSQIISDLQTAIDLLPNTVQAKTLPTKACAYGFLSRTYLSMSDYDNSLKYATLSINANSTLTDYNTLIPTAFALTNLSQFPLSECLYISTMNNYNLDGITRAIVDSTLYASYQDNDLRKSDLFVLYTGHQRYIGSYDFLTSNQYNGVANDEVYLNRAECNARKGNTSAAMNDLNTLLVKRYKTGTYVNRTASGPQDALSQILLERRKELCFRGTRWTDLRRLNLDPSTQTTLTRNINGAVYTLPPNDLRYVLLIPDQEIQLTGIPQNPR